MSSATESKSLQQPKEQIVRGEVLKETSMPSTSVGANGITQAIANNEGASSRAIQLVKQPDSNIAETTSRSFNPTPSSLKYTTDKILKLKELGFAAHYYCGPGRAVPAYLGDTTGVFPVHVCSSLNSKDTFTPVMDRGSPTFPQQLLYRHWFLSRADARRVEMELPALFTRKGRAMRGNWFDLGVDTDLQALQLEIYDFANDLGIRICTDDEVRKIIASALVEQVQP